MVSMEVTAALAVAAALVGATAWIVLGRARSPWSRSARRLRLAALVALAAVPLLGAARCDNTGGATAIAVRTAPSDGSTAPAVSAAAFAVYDPQSGEFLASHGLHERRPVGSLMKLLTAEVALRAGSPDRMVVVPELRIAPDESAIGLRPGEQQRRDVLLRAMLIVSANDAAQALAIDVGGSTAAFVKRMNETAAELGLRDTRAANPVGLDAPEQHSSAHDVVLLGEHLMRDPDFRETVARRSARLHGETFAATNDLLGSYEGADGIKTGRTRAAGYCLLASATRGGRRMVAVVLGAPTEAARDASAAALLDWGFSQ